MTEPAAITLTSFAFAEGASIPSLYTCEGDNTSPPLSWSGVPEGAVSLALTLYDPDVPTALRPEGFFDHWTLYSIPPETTELSPGGTAGAAGINGRGAEAYTGPCPPAEYEPSEHRYIFTLYALDTTINFIKAPTRAELETAIEGHILGKGTLMGRYKKVH